MRKGKWVVAGALVLGAVAAAYAGAAWYAGKQVQVGLDGGYRQLQKYGPYLVVTKRVYDRGIFSATETVNIGFFAPAVLRPPQKLVEFTLVSRIRHLPLSGWRAVPLAAIDSTVNFVPGSVPEEEVWTGGADLARVHTDIALNGAVSTTLALPAFDAPRLNSEPATVTIRFPADLARYTVQGSAPRFTITGERGDRLQISGILISGEHRRMLADAPDLYAGTDRMSIEALEASATGGAPPASLRQIAAEVSAVPREDGEFMDTTVKYSLASASIAGASFGPAQLEVSFRHLHTRSFANLARVEAPVPGDPVPGVRGGRKDQDVTDLIMHAPELSARLAVTVPAGETVITAQARLQGVQPTDLQGNGDALRGKLQVQVDARAPVRAVIDDRGMPYPPYVPLGMAIGHALDAGGLGQLIAAGYVTRDGEYLQTRFELHDGRYWLNGKEYVVPEAGGNGAAGQPPCPRGAGRCP